MGQHHGDLRRALLDAALALVDEGGDPREITLRAVARRAGVSPGAPYHHFPDKTAMLAAVSREGFEALAEVQAGCAQSDPSERLQAMAEAYVRFAVAHRTHYAVMFADAPGAVRGDSGDQLREAAMATFGTLVGAIGAVQPSLSRAEQLRRALVAWSLAHGAVEVSRWADDLQPGFESDQLAADVGRQVLVIAVA